MEEAMLSFLEWYGRVVHPPLVLLLCCAGSAGHLLSIHTLASMLNPTNALLISMSCCQLLLCANFLYATLFKWASDELCAPFFFSQWMARSLHLSVHLSVLLHMAGVFHVVALSLVRFFSLKKLASASSSALWFTYPICKRITIAIYCSVVIIGIPLYFTSDIKMEAEKTECVRRFEELRGIPSFVLSFSSNQFLQTFNFWLFHMAAKVVPSVVLCVMTWLILDKLKQIRILSARFATSARDKQHNRTNMMILTIMFMFIVVELPQGLLAVMSTFADLPLLSALGDLNEMVTLLTSCLIFALFCGTSGKVREAILNIPCIKAIREVETKLVETTSASFLRVGARGGTDKALLEIVTPDVDMTHNYAEV